MKLKKLLAAVEKITPTKCDYYNMLNFQKVLKIDNICDIEDTVFITPFYIFEKTYELYEYELKIEKTMDKIYFNVKGEQFLKDITFKSNSKDNINKNIDKYLNYIINSALIKQNITELFGDFNPENLFFEYIEI